MKICNLAGQKRQCDVFLQGNLLDPGPFATIATVTTNKGQRKNSAGQTPQKYFEVASLAVGPVLKGKVVGFWQQQSPSSAVTAPCLKVGDSWALCGLHLFFFSQPF